MSMKIRITTVDDGEVNEILGSADEALEYINANDDHSIIG